MNLESQEADVDRTGQPEGADLGNRRGPIKFAYASGAQPLEGYTIKRGIGAGGFGDVYYATSDAGKDVALKRIQRNLDVEIRGVSQCLNLKHQNLVALYDIRYDDQQQAWVVMEYVAGESLQDVIERNPNGLPDDQVLMWLGGIVEGVAYLHDHGIVHRDLKPGNIFMDQGTVKIGDYGLSKFISCSRRSGQTESVGTFHYMAPEIGLGRYGKEIDIYALGILLHEMLTGSVPFDGESSQEIIMKHLTATPDLQRVAKAYRPVIARALAKDPAERYRSARDLFTATQGGVVPPAVSAGGARSTTQATRVSPKIHQAKAATADAMRQACDWTRRDEEPIAAAVREMAHKFRDSWRNNLTSGGRALLAIVIVLTLFVNFAWIAPTAFLVAVSYSVYYLMWYLFLRDRTPRPPTPDQVHQTQTFASSAAAQKGQQERAAGAATPPVAPKRRQRHLTRQQLNDGLRNALQKKTFFQWASELTGSMLMSAFVAGVLALFIAMFDFKDPSLSISSSWAPVFAWLAVTSTAAAWAVLFFGKLWEGSEGDQALRRFCMMVAGMCIGGFAYVMYQGLMLDPVYVVVDWHDLNHAVLVEAAPDLYGVGGDPHPVAFAGYFGGLFLLLRWWLAADPLRNSRLSIWATAVTAVLALAGYGVLPIPRGFLVIATTMVAVQLSASWVHPQRRREFKQRLTAA